MSPECTGLLLPLLPDRCHSDPACILNSAYPDRLRWQAESCLPHPSFKVFALKLQAVPYRCQTIDWMLGRWRQVLGRMEAGVA